MEIKVLCDCGQKFKFDVEPINGEMPFNVNCPACGVDRTSSANAVLAQTVPAAEAVAVAAPVGRLQLNRTSDYAPPTPPPPIAAAPRPIRPPVAVVAQRKAKAPSGEFNIGLGTLGAFLGAGVGVGVMFGFYMLGRISFSVDGGGNRRTDGFWREAALQRNR